MINALGIIQNNNCVKQFLKDLKSDKHQYKTLNKKEERNLINKYLKENKEGELRELLTLHNIRMVFSIAKKYCKNTRDFDNMFAKGLYGLVIAANRFDFHEPVKVKFVIGSEPMLDYNGNPKIDKKTGKPKERILYKKKTKINAFTCKPEPVKFCTYANQWIFKYIVDEFEQRSIHIDNNSISINAPVKIKNSFDNNQTMENYIEDMVSPDYHKNKPLVDVVSSNEARKFYDKIGEYLKETNELTSLEKEVIVDTYYNNMKVKDIAQKENINPQNITNIKKTALSKLKKFLSEKYNVNKINDIVEI